MRIISGAHKGRKIRAPKNLPVRPTTDRAKEGLFNMLHHRVTWGEIHALDLFSGTGNISYELASRGVKKISAIDQNRHCVNFIRKTAQELHFPIAIFQKDVLRFVANPFQSFDLIFADPPYDFEKSHYEVMIDDLIKNNFLTEAGVLIVEHSEQIKLEDISCFSSSRQYGSSVFSFFETP